MATKKKPEKTIKAVALATGHDGTRIIQPGEVFMVAKLDGDWFKAYKGQTPVGGIDLSVVDADEDEDEEGA